MIIPVVQLPSRTFNSTADPHLALNVGEADALTTRLGCISEVVLQGSGEKIPGGADPSVYKAFLREGPYRVGPFDVFLGLQAPELRELREHVTTSIVSWLDSGARRAIVKVDVSRPEAVSDLAEWSKQLPASRHRLVASFRARDVRADKGGGGGGFAAALSTIMDGLRPVVGCVQVDFEKEYGVAQEMLAQLKGLRGKEGSSDFVELVFARDPGGDSDSWWSPEEIGKLHLESSVDVQCPASLESQNGDGVGLTSCESLRPHVDAANAFIACLRTDRDDGLIATVVCDTTGVALGLVYSNPASIRASLTSGRGVYWSRSRGCLWRKGDTSGAWQELRSVSVDCDSDALKFTVWQHGTPPAFCHMNRRNCWEGDRGIGHLERTLAQRKQEAPEGSYTKRLFEDPVLLRNKLVEEAQELAEADTKKLVAEEAADVTYFMMVRCAAAGVSFEDVEKELDMRSLKLKRRAGNAKAERIAEGDKILGQGRKTQAASVI